MFQLIVTTDKGRIPPDFSSRCTSILTRAKIGHEIEAQKSFAKIDLFSASDAELRFVIRLLQRAGFTIEVSEK